MSIKCSKCGEPLKPEMVKCPKCGSGDRDVKIEESCKIHEMLDVKVKTKDSRKFSVHVRQGEKVGKDGEVARETRRIDREKRRYYHRIQKQNEKGEWVTTHEEDEPLEKHDSEHREKKS